jgi:hypothetical protein
MFGFTRYTFNFWSRFSTNTENDIEQPDVTNTLLKTGS